jgi:UDP-N-acetyl-D-mannosaminuronate dehydrogenase
MSDNQASIVQEARSTNKNMPIYFVNSLLEKVNSLRGRKILVLGISYRPKVKEVAFSGAYDLKEILISLGALPYFQDPLYTEKEIFELGFDPGKLNNETELIIIHTAHEEYARIDFTKFPGLRYILDGRGILGRGIGVIKC